MHIKHSIGIQNSHSMKAVSQSPHDENPEYWVDIKDISVGPKIGSGQFSTVHGNFFIAIIP
jgi:hypothetical protein